MNKKIRKILLIAFSLLILNWLLIMIGWSPFGWHHFFPDYYDDVKYWAPAWMDNNHILFMKSVNNWRMETGMLFFDGRRFIDYKTYLCSMKIDGAEKTELLEIPKGFGVGYISCSNNGIVILSGAINEVGKIAAFNISSKEYSIIGEGREADISSDGKQLAYSDNGILVMDINGQNKLQFTDNPSDTHPLWSPDGKMIAFYREKERDPSELIVLDVNKMKFGNIGNKIFDGWDNKDNMLWISLGLGWSDKEKRYLKKMTKVDMSGKVIEETNNLESLKGSFSPDMKYILGGYQDNQFFISDLNYSVKNLIKNYKNISYGKRNRNKSDIIWIKE